MISWKNSFNLFSNLKSIAKLFLGHKLILFDLVHFDVDARNFFRYTHVKLNNLLKKCKTSLNSPPRIKSQLMGQKKCFSYAFDDAFVKFIYSEKATIFLRNLHLFLTGTIYIQKNGDFAKFLWPSQNIWALKGNTY